MTNKNYYYILTSFALCESLNRLSPNKICDVLRKFKKCNVVSCAKYLAFLFSSYIVNTFVMFEDLIPMLLAVNLV